MTITIHGTNDQPEITVDTMAGDSDSAALMEGNAALMADGTLTLSDDDTTDMVNVSVDSTIGTTGGTYAGPSVPNQTDLFNMFMFTTGTDSLSNAQDTGQLEWNFDSGSEAFDFLNDGETLVLTYTITADDNLSFSGSAPNEDSVSAAQTVTITITGTNDVPSITGATNPANICLLYTSPSPRDATLSRMPSSA